MTRRGKIAPMKGHYYKYKRDRLVFAIEFRTPTELSQDRQSLEDNTERNISPGKCRLHAYGWVQWPWWPL